MLQKVIHFIKYHNAFTIIVGAVFLSFGISYAASPAVRESVYSSEETVVSVDNTAVVSADLNGFNFNLQINSITEDEAYYYVVYSYQTLVVENGVWQNTGIEKILKVSKEALGGKDMELYVMEELSENINSERFYLKRVQSMEKKKGESKKVVAVEYSGLIGKVLKPKEKVINTPEIASAESNKGGGNPIFVLENETPEPLPSPAISDSVVEATTGAPTPVVETGDTSGTASESASFTTGQSPTPIPTLTPAEELSPTASASESPTPTPEVPPSPTPSETPTPSPTPELTPSPTPEPTPELTPTPEPTPESTPTPTPTPTPTEEPLE